MVHMMDKCNSHCAVPNGCHLLSELSRRHRNAILKTAFHHFLSFTFDDVEPVLLVRDFYMKYTVKVVLLHMYIG